MLLWHRPRKKRDLVLYIGPPITSSPCRDVLLTDHCTVLPTITPIRPSAKGSSNFDGHKLSYKWWQYYDADTAKAKIKIANATSHRGCWV